MTPIRRPIILRRFIDTALSKNIFNVCRVVGHIMQSSTLAAHSLNHGHSYYAAIYVCHTAAHYSSLYRSHPTNCSTVGITPDIAEGRLNVYNSVAWNLSRGTYRTQVEENVHLPNQKKKYSDIHHENKMNSNGDYTYMLWLTQREWIIQKKGVLCDITCVCSRPCLYQLSMKQGWQLL